MIRIVAPHFVAGVDLSVQSVPERSTVQLWMVVHAAPILNYMRGWSKDKVLIYCARKGWTAEVLT